MVIAQAHFASWEPRFSKNCHKYPWHLYVKLGGVLRHFGYTAVALHGCLESEIQVHDHKYFLQFTSIYIANSHIQEKCATRGQQAKM